MTQATTHSEDIVLDESEDVLDRLLGLLLFVGGRDGLLCRYTLFLGRFQGLLLSETFSQFALVR